MFYCAEPIPLAPLKEKALWVSVYSTFHRIFSASNISYLPRNSPHKYMGVLTSYQVYLRAQDTRPHNQQDQPAEQTSLFHLLVICVPLVIHFFSYMYFFQFLRCTYVRGSSSYLSCRMIILSHPTHLFLLY